MKYSIKKMIIAFISTVISVSMSANCIFVGASDLPNNGGGPYNEETGAFILDDKGSPPEVTMSIVIGEDAPPTPEYDLSLDWGAMKLLYTFTTDAQGTITGGSWGESFDGINNQIKITNNSTSHDIVYDIVYIGMYDSNNPIYIYSQGIKLSNIYDPTNTEAPYGTIDDNLKPAHAGKLFRSGNLEGNFNYANFYIYDKNDIYTMVCSGAMPNPTESIVDTAVGIITVEACYLE